MEIHNLGKLKGFLPDRPRFQLLHDSPNMRVVLFGFMPGQEMAPHSAPSEICFSVVEGEGKVLVGKEEQEVAAGAVVLCPPNALHGIKATKNMVVLAIIAPRPE